MEDQSRIDYLGKLFLKIDIEIAVFAFLFRVCDS